MGRRVALVALFVLVASVSFAQEVVELRFYIVPKTGDGLTPATAFRPKYFEGISTSNRDYGLENTFLVGADVTPAQHTLIASNLDVIAIPQNINAPIGLTALQTVKDKLEALHVPAHWVTTEHTYRQVIAAVGRLFLFMGRFHARQARTFFESGVTLDLRLNQLTQTQREALEDAAISLGLDLSRITQTTTIRQAFKALLDQMPSFSLHGESF